MLKAIFSAALMVATLALVCPQAALAAPLSAQSIDKMGDGSAVTCNTTPATVADSTLTAPSAKWLFISNPIGNATVYIGGASVGANGLQIRGGETRVLPVTANAVLKCYAASATTIGVVGAI